jgi:AbrB family looped-hinge helix DNA binding protein
VRTTIDGAGRVVIPKALRDAAGISAGVELDIELRDGRIEIEAAATAMLVVAREGGAVIEADGELPVLTADAVRAVLDSTRR